MKLRVRTITEHQIETPKPYSRLTTAQYAEARQTAAGGAKAKQIAAQFGVKLDVAYRISRTAHGGGHAGTHLTNFDRRLH